MKDNLQSKSWHETYLWFHQQACHMSQNSTASSLLFHLSVIFPAHDSCLQLNKMHSIVNWCKWFELNWPYVSFCYKLIVFWVWHPLLEVRTLWWKTLLILGVMTLSSFLLSATAAFFFYKFDVTFSLKSGNDNIFSVCYVRGV